MILLGIAFYIQSRPVKKQELGVFSLMMFGGAFWAFANAIQLITPDLGWQRFWNGVTYAGIMLVPTTWFLLAAKVTGFQREIIERFERFFWVPPALLYFLLLTSGWHHLFFTSFDMTAVAGYLALENHYGVLFYIHTVYSYMLLLIGIILMTVSLVTNFKKYGIQAYGLIIGVLAPLAGNVYFLFGSPPAGFPDPTPIIFTVTGIAFAWAIFSGHILEVVPLAHEAIVRKLATGVLVLDAEKNIRDINDAAREMLDLKGRTYAGASLSALVEKHREIALLVDKALNASVHEDQKMQVTFPDTHRTFDVHISHLGNGTHTTTGWLIQFNDISAEKLAEQNMIATQQTMKVILNTLQDSFFEADPNGIITYANKAMITHLGFTNWEEVQGKNFRNFVARASIRDIIEKFRLLYQMKQPLEPFEYQYRTKDGSVLVGQMTVSPIMEGERVLGSRGSIRDVTARINAEKEILRQKELLDSLLQQSPIAMVINDMDKKITVANPAFEKLFGYAQADVIGKSLDELISP
ncbi:MAG: histidine kinase N-terminal 7TM domain-containing protein [Anaerolineales bacterium]